MRGEGEKTEAYHTWSSVPVKQVRRREPNEAEADDERPTVWMPSAVVGANCAWPAMVGANWETATGGENSCRAWCLCDECAIFRLPSSSPV